MKLPYETEVMLGLYHEHYRDPFASILLCRRFGVIPSHAWLHMLRYCPVFELSPLRLIDILPLDFLQDDVVLCVLYARLKKSLLRKKSCPLGFSFRAAEVRRLPLHRKEKVDLLQLLSS